MSWILLLFVGLLVASILILLGLAVYLVVRPPEGAKRAEIAGIVVLSLGAAWWSVTKIVILWNNDVATMHRWYVFGDIGATFVVIGWFVFTAAYTDRDRWLSKDVLGSLALLHVLVLGLFVTDPIHGLIFTDVGRVDAGGFYTPDLTKSWLYYLCIQVYYVPTFLGTAFIGIRFVTDETMYTGQRLLLILSAGVPVATDLKSQLHVGPFPNYQFTSMAFTVTALAITVGIVRYRLLEIGPVGRRRVVREMRDGYLVLDYADRVVDYNRAAATLFGFDDPVGKPVDDLLPAEWDLDTDEESTDLILGAGDDRRFVEVSYSPLGYDQGLVLLRDVTDRRAVEKRYQRLIEMASDVVLVLDEDRRITYASPSLKRVIGVAPDSLTGTFVDDIVHPEDHDTVDATLASLQEHPGEGARVECRVSNPNGDYETVDVSLRNLVADPFVEGIVVNARLITERKERERQLQRKNERLDQFASIVSHDLRNPLTVAQGRLHLAKEDSDSEHFGPIESALERMETIIGDTLALAQEGETVAEPRPVHVDGFCERCWDQVDTKGATLERLDSFHVAADPDRLQQIFENLFRNAVEHAGEDAVIRVGRLDDGFYVEDDGPGIPAANREKVFEAGHTTREDGTGFGLAIVSEIVDAHGWDVSVSEGADGGARFDITGVEVE